METIKSRAEFERVFRGGMRLNHPVVRMSVMRSDEGSPSRVAFVAAKRLGNAVYRNRCKRVLRAAAQQAGLPIEGRDVILFSTRKTHDATSTEVACALGSLMGRLRP